MMKTPFIEKKTHQDTLLSTQKDSNIKDHYIDTTQIQVTKYLPRVTFIVPKTVIKNNDSISKHEFCEINFNDNSLVDNYIYYKWFDAKLDSNCYIINKQIIKKNNILHFIELKEEKKKISYGNVIKQRIELSNDWVFIPSLIGLVFLVGIITFYRKYIGLLFESIFFRYSNNKILNERNTSYQKLSFILDILYIISFSLAINQIVKGLQFFSPPENLKYIVFVAFACLLLALKLFRILVFKLSSLFSNHKTFLKDLLNSSSLYTRTLGIILVPLAFLMTYSTSTINTISIYATIITIVIVMIMRSISMIRSFILAGISIFYFILYLCALEIVPLLIIIKEVRSR